MFTIFQDLTDRFHSLIEGVCRAVYAGNVNNRSPEPFIFLILQHLRRLAARFASLAARAQAGTLRPARPRPVTPRPILTMRSPRVLPRHWAWLAELMSHPDPHRAELHALLAAPELAALVAAAPQSKKILRPLAVMLGAGLAPELRLPPTPKAIAVAECREARARYISLKLRNRLGLPLRDDNGRPWVRPTLKRRVRSKNRA